MRWPIEQGLSSIIAACRTATGLVFAQQIQASGDLFKRIGETVSSLVDEPFVMGWFKLASSVYEMIINYDIGAFLTDAIISVEAFTKAGDKRNACSQRMDVGYTYFDLGFYQQAVETLYYTIEESLPLALHRIPTGSRRPLCLSLANLGRFEDARREAKLGIEEFSRQGDLFQESGIRIYLARIEMMQGNLSAAEEQVQMVLASLPPGATSRPAAMAAAAKLALLKGQGEDAAEYATIAVQKFKPLGGVNVGESFIRLTYAEVMIATAPPEEARAAVIATVQNIRERAGKILQEEYRESFLHNVPENAAVLALGERFGV